MENTRSDSAENRLICATLFAFFASGAASVLVGNLMPFIREAYGIGYSKAGFLLSFPAWGNLAAVFITGFLPTYIGRRRTVLLTAVWMAVAFAIIGFGIGGSALLPAACLMIGVARGGNSNFSNTMMSTLPGKNPFVNHELMSISLNSTSKWRARNMPSFLEYIEAKGKLPTCLTMSFAAYIAFFSNDIQELTDAGLVCRRPKGNTYVCSDDRWALEFYFEHRNDTAEELVRAVMTNQQMWGQDLTEIPGFEAATVENLKKIRTEGALAAYASCL